MIKYALGCAEGHAFDSWFPDSAAYEKQRKRGFVACPECGSTGVDKAIMAPGGGRRRARGGRIGPGDCGRRPAPEGARDSSCACVARSRPTPTTSAPGFPEVARAIHLGEEPERAIRGRASLEEARSLSEDGMGVLPMPMLEDELN